MTEEDSYCSVWNEYQHLHQHQQHQQEVSTAGSRGGSGGKNRPSRLGVERRETEKLAWQSALLEKEGKGNEGKMASTWSQACGQGRKRANDKRPRGVPA